MINIEEDIIIKYEDGRFGDKHVENNYHKIPKISEDDFQKLFGMIHNKNKYDVNDDYDIYMLGHYNDELINLPLWKISIQM